MKATGEDVTMLEATAHKLMTIDEFIERYDAEGPFEIYDGEIVPLMPTVQAHTYFLRTLFLLLYNFSASRKLGEVFQEAVFILEKNRQWVEGSRVPDIVFFAAARWAAYMVDVADHMQKPNIIVPDLVVEILSPTDKAVNVNRKLAAYLKDGVKLIWLINTDHKTVTVYHGSTFATLSETDTLTGEDIIPGFEVNLADYFTYPPKG